MQDNVTHTCDSCGNPLKDGGVDWYCNTSGCDEELTLANAVLAAERHRLASTTAQTEAVQKLVDALEAISQHAGHTEECSFYWDGGQSCDCGYLAAHVKKAQALAAHREALP